MLGNISIPYTIYRVLWHNTFHENLAVANSAWILKSEGRFRIYTECRNKNAGVLFNSYSISIYISETSIWFSADIYFVLSEYLMGHVEWFT